MATDEKNVSTGKAEPSELQPGRGEWNDPLRAARRRLRILRIAGRIVLVIEVAVLAACWHFALMQGGRWAGYLGSLGAVLAWYHALPTILVRWLPKVAARVYPRGDGWRIGKYSEAELRGLIAEATAGLPPRLRRLRVSVVDVRWAAAWTWLSVFLPGRAKQVFLTSGSLHYLERDELVAVLLHEIAHHLPGNRATVWGGWVLADATWHALAFWFYALTGSGAAAVWAFVLLRWLGFGIGIAAVGNVGRSVELLCDRWAAERAGPVPTVNALVKLAEDGELSEVVLVWAARDLMDDESLTLDDLVLALAEARPYGRIFHENLIRHANEVCRILRRHASPTAKDGKSGKENAELREFVEKRRNRQSRRIRWRRFDGDGDGILTAAEITRLCEMLLSRPDDVLVTSQDEWEPTTHPRCRDRILLLWEAFPSHFAEVGPIAAQPFGQADQQPAPP